MKKLLPLHYFFSTKRTNLLLTTLIIQFYKTVDFSGTDLRKAIEHQLYVQAGLLIIL